MQNIIISRYPIVSEIFKKYDDTNDEIFGTKTLTGANISIDGNIISIYSTELTRDIKNAGIINTNKRRHELKVLRTKIKKNMSQLKTNDYFKTDIHILLGSFNIAEYIDDELNEEFISFIKRLHCVDFFRHMYAKATGTTDSTDKRKDYIMLLLTDDIYQPNSEMNESFNKITVPADLFKFIMKRYKIHFLETTVVNTIGDLYPIETVMMMSKNMH
jgi:hypothetical protein